ncbi:hypothetical protein [Actinomadura formosensis]|uniref:hypothetical protein n=1 Tax=Actinomadura formosensis TaxID=60706 RepID=UPI00083340AD|nr:hypothetical protein [Actinomadura formosensis]
MTVHEIETTVTRLRALEWLTRQPLDRLPVLVWFAHEDGGLVRHRTQGTVAGILITLHAEYRPGADPLEAWRL